MWKIEKIIKKGDYDYAIVRDHPNRTKNNYVLHHRVVMENFLGRLLFSYEVVHHKDGNKKNNHIDNLELLDPASHAKHHSNERGSTWVELCCPSCGKIFQRERRQTFLSKKTSDHTTCSNRCRGTFSNRIRLQGRTLEVETAISVNIVREYKKYSHDNPEVTDDDQEP